MANFAADLKIVNLKKYTRNARNAMAKGEKKEISSSFAAAVKPFLFRLVRPQTLSSRIPSVCPALVSFALSKKELLQEI